MAVFAGQVSASSDDAGELVTGGTTDLAGLNYAMQTGGGSGQILWAGLRFLNVTIPRGAVVSAADIQLKHDSGTKAVNIDVTIQAQAADNPATFTTAGGNIDTRSRTTASVTWTATWSSTTQYNTSPDISSVIQEVLNRALWVSGNTLVIVLNARSTSAGEFATYNTGPGTGPPKLDITYTLAAPPQPRPRRVFQAVNRSGTY